MTNQSPSQRLPGSRLAALTTAAIAVLGIAGCGSSARESVVVSMATARTLRYSPGGFGFVVPAIDRAVIVERRATVLEVDVVEGQRVRAGQTLLRVYTIGQSLAVAEATNTLRADEKRLPFVEAQYGAVGSTTQSLLNQIATDRKELTQLAHAPTVLTAPVAGRVSGLKTLAGATLDRSDAVLHVVDDSVVRAVVPILVGYRAQLTVGQHAVMSLPSSPGSTFAATIIGVGPVVPAQADGKATSAEETVPITVELANVRQLLTDGSAAYVRFPLVRRAAVTVNSLAVLGQDRPFVFVVEHGIVHQREVVVGASDGVWTEIQSGLAAGGAVVISGGNRLVDGTHVAVVRSEHLG